MLSSIEGIYRDGKIKLVEMPTNNIRNNTRVIVTFLKGSDRIDLRARGIGEVQAADLLGRLSTFVEDWESSEMDIYDDYDKSKSNI